MDGVNNFIEEFGAILPFALIIQEEGRIVFANIKAQRLFSGTGSDKVEIEGRSVADFLESAVDGDSNGITFQDSCKSTTLSVNKVVLPNSSPHDFCSISTGILFKGKPATLTILQDITDEKDAERKFRETEWCYQSLSQSSIVGVFLYSGGRFYYANSYIENLLGYSSIELADICFHDLVFPEDRDYPEEKDWDLLSGKRQKQFRMVRKDGKVVYVETYSSTMECDGSPAVLGTMLDITHLKKVEESIRYMAYHDPLTDLPNRRLFNEYTAGSVEFCKLHNMEMGVMFIDLDRFKAINDTFGHNFGDEILRQASKRLNECIEEECMIFRNGGDEFVIVLKNAGKAKCARIAQRIVKAFNRPFKYLNCEAYTTSSIGISLFPGDGDNVDTFVINADAAMYYSKISGKSKYQFFTPALKKNMTRALELENGLRRALSKKEFRLHYQPQFELKSGRLSGAEVLARWQHPVLGEVSPADFIPRAEDIGLILPLGEWILETACRQNRSWQDSNYPCFPIAVNVSGCQLKHSDFTRTVTRILKKTKLDPKYLIIEITESVMQDIKKTSRIVNELRAIGVKVAIDDFGMGYSSLNVLKSLPIDILKIDQSFILDAATNPNTVTLIKFIIKMGHLLKSEIVAEGVENAQQAIMLKRERCNIGQGYYFNRPLTASCFEDVLKEIS